MLPPCELVKLECLTCYDGPHEGILHGVPIWTYPKPKGTFFPPTIFHLRVRAQLFYESKLSNYEGQSISTTICIHIRLLKIWLLKCIGSKVVMRNPSFTRYLVGVFPAMETAKTIDNSELEVIPIFSFLEQPSVNQSLFHNIVSIVI